MTHTISTIRGVPEGKDIISPNRFPYYERNKEDAFLAFIENVSEQSGGKPVGVKVVISDRGNIEPLVKAMKKLPVEQ